MGLSQTDRGFEARVAALAFLDSRLVSARRSEHAPLVRIMVFPGFHDGFFEVVFVVERASLATFSGYLKGGVRDGHSWLPVYIEVVVQVMCCLKTCLSQTGHGFRASKLV